MSTEGRPVRVLYSFPHKLGAGRICTTAWEQIKLDIEDNPVIPVVWKERLLLIWLRIMKQAPLDPEQMPDEEGIFLVNIEWFNRPWDEFGRGEQHAADPGERRPNTVLPRLLPALVLAVERGTRQALDDHRRGRFETPEADHSLVDAMPARILTRGHLAPAERTGPLALHADGSPARFQARSQSAPAAPVVGRRPQPHRHGRPGQARHGHRDEGRAAVRIRMTWAVYSVPRREVDTSRNWKSPWDRVREHGA